MVLSMDRWVNKVCIVTGASAGIGASIARQLVNTGLKVVGLARRVEKVEELAKKLEGKPGKLYAFKADLTKEEDILAAFAWVKNNVGPVHILINNAGISQPTNLTNGNTEMWKKVLDTNVLGVSIATREAIKVMKDNNIDGHVVHINSILGHYVGNIPNSNMYSASKFALTALTETLRLELLRSGSKIRVSGVSPGPVETEFATANNLYANKEYEKVYKALPKLQDEDVADAVIYVLSTPPHVQVQDILIRPVGY